MIDHVDCGPPGKGVTKVTANDAPGWSSPQDEREAKDPKLAAKQHWVIHRSQALECGMTERMIDYALATGEWKRILPGIYLIGQATPTYRTRLMAAVLWAGPGAAVSGEAAGALFGLKGCEEKIEITVPKKINANKEVKVRVDPLLKPTHLAAFDHIPMTRMGRTLFDICRTSRLEVASTIIADALRKKLIDLPRLGNALDEFARPGVGGTRKLRQILHERFAFEVTDSDAEDLFLKMGRRRGYRFEFHRVVRDGSFVAELDFADPLIRLDIEIDGDQDHNDPVAKQRDKNRDVELSRRGWLVLRFTYWDLVQRSDWVFESIAAAIATRSTEQLSLINHT